MLLPTVTINPAFLKEIKDDNRHLRDLRIALRALTTGSAPLRQQAATQLSAWFGKSAKAAPGAEVTPVGSLRRGCETCGDLDILAAGLAPWSIAPSSCFVFQQGQPADLALEPLLLALGSGLLPVVYGDVVMDRGQGVAICSTERMLEALARRLPVRRVHPRHEYPAFRTRHPARPSATPAARPPIPAPTGRTRTNRTRTNRTRTNRSSRSIRRSRARRTPSA